MKEKQTPLMKQYLQIKSKYQDSILLFRMGDFYETFYDDAVITSKVCGITLTKRNHGVSGDCPLAGFPYHQLDAYLPKLVKAGYKVAVCDQLEDPKFAKGIVKRGVTEVITPGITLYDKLLDTNRNNYLVGITAKKIQNLYLLGVSSLDVSTGEFFCTEITSDKLIEYLTVLNPGEIIISKSQKKELLELLSKMPNQVPITKLEEWFFDLDFAKDKLQNHFKIVSLKGFGIENYSLAISSAGAVLQYVDETQMGKSSHIKKIYYNNTSQYMALDYSTMRNLEITYSISGNYSKNGTLISILDRTLTAMGGRLLIKWITRPLIQLKPIQQRLSIVSTFVKNIGITENLRNELKQINDLERLVSKISSGKSNPRDLLSLKLSLERIPYIKSLLSKIDNENLIDINQKLVTLDDLVEILNNALKEDPSTTLGSGNIFKTGYSKELDEFINAKYSGKNWIADFQKNERLKTNIPSLKVDFNNVFGYYIEITKTHSHKVPKNYERKQTLTNSERYTTTELKEIERKILIAEEKILELETKLLNELNNIVSNYITQIQDIAILIANIDCLQSFAIAAFEHNYTEPTINESNIIKIQNGRHPVVEKLLPYGTNFIPNNTYLNNDDQMIHIITGPNMSGKSCYLRQVGLIVLMGQIGSFVPAEKAEFGIIDRIFTRVGAQDNITLGESTFLVEMQEVANIINNASTKSLLLLDEVGRGTATFDGISIAWSLSEYIHNVLQAKTLFATHYHELIDLAAKYEKIYNYKVEVIEAGDKIIFTHKVLEGFSDHSFGIHVAQMAGLPNEITDRAEIIMKSFESESNIIVGKDSIKTKQIDGSKIKSKKTKFIPNQMSIFEFKDDILREQLRNLDINNITPLEALKILEEMKKKASK